MAITDSWLKANYKKPRAKSEEKADGDGLGVRASAKGKLVFQMRCRIAGKPARIDLGTYPLTSLKEARAKHLEMKGLLEQGRDPRVEVKVSRLDAITLKDLFMKWYADYCAKEKASAAEILRSFEIYVFEELGDLPADEIPAHQWADLLEEIKAKAPTIAVRVLQNARQMYRWGVRRQLVPANPLSDFSAREDLLITKGSRGRALSDEEITVVFKSLRSSRIADSSKIYIMLCLLLGCRNGELRTLNPQEDLDLARSVWILPVEKNKTRKKIDRPVVRHLTPLAISLIKEAMRLSKDPALLFTTESHGRMLNSRSTLSWPNLLIKTAAKRLGYKMKHWSLHDLRKTARTNFSSLTEVHVAEIMLGHSIKGIQGVYDHHLYLEEQAAAYESWHSKLSSLSDGVL